MQLTQDEKRKRIEHIIAMRADERTLDYCGRQYGISRQRVSKLLERHYSKQAELEAAQVADELEQS